MINVFQPSYDERDVEAVTQVLQTSWTGKGELVDEFEARFAEHLGSTKERVCSVTCCTEGLFQILELIELKPEDEVIMPSNSFVGAANAVTSFGATPVFCDVETVTQNASWELIQLHITTNTKAIIILHFGGTPGDVQTIAKQARLQGITLIEDAACAVASSVNSQACGTFGDFGVWSFDSMKILSSGDGGMIWAKDPEDILQLRKQIYLGIEGDGIKKARTDLEWWKVNPRYPGRRAIINDITAALATSQLKKLPEFIRIRERLSQSYDDLLAEVEQISIAAPLPAEHKSSYYFYWIKTASQYRNHLAGYLKLHGIYTTLKYWPLHKTELYKSEGNLPNVTHISETTLLLPLHQSLTQQEIVRICDVIKTFFNKV